MNNTKPLIVRLSIAFAATCLVAAASGSAIAQDKAKPATGADQRGRKVLVENEKVLATENSYKPGSSSGMVERKARVVRALTDGTFEKTFSDGRKETITWKAGQVRYSPTETYDQKNTGKTEILLYTVTLK